MGQPNLQGTILPHSKLLVFDHPVTENGTNDQNFPSANIKPNSLRTVQTQNQLDEIEPLSKQIYGVKSVNVAAKVASAVPDKK